MKTNLDKEIATLLQKYGTDEVLASLCRRINHMGMPVLFRKLNRVYEWLKAPPKS